MARIRKEKNNAKGSKADIVWRIGVYIRLSREDGNDESESVINQRKILEEFLEDDFDGIYEVVDYYVDDGLTGTDDTRAEFMRLIQDIEKHKVNCMLCKTLARAFRNYSDQGYYLEDYFTQKRVRFVSTGDPYVDTYENPDAVTGLEVPISGLMNDRYASRTSNDVRRTFKMKRQKGEFIGAFPPYGYLKDPANKNRLIPDSAIVPIKRDILGWILNDGMSLRGVSQRLNELGVPNPTAYKESLGWNYNNPNTGKNDGLWTGVTIKRMLLDKMNLGHMVQGKQRVVSYKVHDKVAVPEDEWFIVENTHEPTFTQEEYDKLLGLFGRDTRTPNGMRNVHLFSGFMRCADCGKAMQRSHARGVVYYKCRTYSNKSSALCTSHSIREELLEKVVLAAVQTQISHLESIADIADAVSVPQAADPQSRRIDRLMEDKRRELNKVQTISDSLYGDWKMGEISREEYQRMRAKAQEQMKQLADVLGNLEEERKRLSRATGSEGAVLEAFLKNGNVQKLDRPILMDLVDTISVHKDKAVTIRFRLADELPIWLCSG